MTKSISARLDDSLLSFLDQVRGELTRAEAIRSIIAYHNRIGAHWTRNIISDVGRINA